jgi:hypothetical protein
MWRIVQRVLGDVYADIERLGRSVLPASRTIPTPSLAGLLSGNILLRPRNQRRSVLDPVRAAHGSALRLFPDLVTRTEHHAFSRRLFVREHVCDQSVYLVSTLVAVRIRAGHYPLGEIPPPEPGLARLAGFFVFRTAPFAPLDEGILQVGEGTLEGAHAIEEGGGSIFLAHVSLPVAPAHPHSIL